MATTMSRAFLGVLLVIGACADSGSIIGVTGDTANLKKRAPAPPSVPPTTSQTNPLSGVTLYSEPTNNALQTAALWKNTRPADALLMENLGHTPQAAWFGNWNSDVQGAVNNLVSGASSVGAVPVLVAYNIPLRDCGSYSAGGANNPDGYRAWIRAFAAGIGSRSAVVVLEPDALAGIGCLSTTDANTRYTLLSDAVQVLKANANTVVYVDAGHPNWISTSEMARRLGLANIAAANGFSLNASNFMWNSDNNTYGSAISALVGGKHFVIDTSRNGQGPTATNEWCNPSGRGLGAKPTTATGQDLVDALLWIKRPGESDGTCNGGPVAGAWWADYALGLAQRATTQLAFN